jgi:hypothetical protein
MSNVAFICQTCKHLIPMKRKLGKRCLFGHGTARRVCKWHARVGDLK